MDDREKMRGLAHYLEEKLTRAKLVGEAPCFLQVMEQLSTVEKSDAAVLLMGETGTGKELFARAIHYLSGRADGPFVALNCGSLPDTLLEDELFGHERGAFTDAHFRRSGLIAQAENGTLFLDEVNSLTARAQVVLLRVLQDKKFRAIGASCEQQANVRVLAATNGRLEQLVQQGTFRADLYYRLSVFTVSLPPLRSRKEDIALLATHFIKKHAPAERRHIRLSPAASAALIDYDWPGNVRELENAIIRGIHRAKKDDWIDAQDFGLPGPTEELHKRACKTGPSMGSFQTLKQQAIALFERTYLTNLMTECRGNVTYAARTAGKERRALGRLLRKHQIDPKCFTVPASRKSADLQLG
jgi:transcriptional regulator with PAS, ATPase and Fis domain